MVRVTSPTHVLVVEDSPTQALELRLTLEAEGFVVQVARDGREGLDVLASAHFDVVVSDVVMPNLSGYDLCRAIKADAALRHLPVILLTSLKEPRDIILGLECGADNYIRKPFDPKHLVGRIRSVVAANVGQGQSHTGFLGDTLATTSTKEQILNFLASTFEDFVSTTMRESENRLEAERERLEAKAARAREELVRREREVLRASEERFRAFMDNHHAIAFMKDEDGRIVYVNAPFLRHFGGAEGDWLGKSDRDLWPEQVATELRENDLAVFASGAPVELVETLPTASGEVRQWSTFKFPFWDADGRRLLGGVAMDVTDRRRAEQEIRTLNVRLERRLDRLHALRRIDLAITASLDLRLMLDAVLDQVTTQLRVDAASVLLLDQDAQVLEYAAGRGFCGPSVARRRLPAREGFAGRAVLEGRLLSVLDLTSEDGACGHARIPEGEEFVAYFAVPLMAKGRVLGVLEVFHRARLDPDREWLDFLEALAAQAAIAADNATLFEDLRRTNAELALAYDATIEGWARALDLRDKETEGHTRRVTEMAVRLAQAEGIRGAELGHIRRGALLHDVGKLAIPDSILLKPGPLTDDEWQVMRRHPTYALEWLAPVAYLRPSLDIPYCHHERWDGTGYPRGLKGEEIPLAARIFAIVDIWDALRSNRPYRKAWPEERVREHLRSLAGTHLDPRVVPVFLHILAADDASAGGPIRPATVDDTARQGGTACAPLPDAERAALHGRLAELSELTTRQNERLETLALELARANSRLAELSAPDTLTGLLSRRNVLEALESAFSFAVRHGQPLSLVLLDVDRLESYNQAHGHPAGDGVLCAIARVIRETIRTYDTAARFAGEEFVVVLPATDARGAREFAERLRAAIAGHGWPLRPVTVSVGIATLTASTLASIELVEEAHEAVRRSKELGRDRVTHFIHLAAHTRETPVAGARAANGEAT